MATSPRTNHHSPTPSDADPERAEKTPTEQIPVTAPRLLEHTPPAGADPLITRESTLTSTAPRRRLRWTVAAMTAAGLLVAGGVGGVVADTVQRYDAATSGAATDVVETASTQDSLLAQLDHVHEGIVVEAETDTDTDTGSESSFGVNRSWAQRGPGAAASTVDSGTVVKDADGVLLIETTTASGAGAGTGMVLTADGLALTNYHVVDGSTEVEVTVADTGDTYMATVVGRDATRDVAVLQLQDASGLETISVNASAVTEGVDVAAVGNGSGQGYLTAVSGTVASTEEEITVNTSEGSGAETRTLTDLIQTDADVVSGYSGGPLVDAEGQVVGMSTAASKGFSTEDVNGYAIPISTALDVVDHVVAGTESDTVDVGPPGALGVTVSTANTPGQSVGRRGYPDTAGTAEITGALVVEVMQDSAAATAGIGAGDVITSVDGVELSTASDLSTAVRSHDPGDRVTVVWRDDEDQEHTASITLQASTVN